MEARKLPYKIWIAFAGEKQIIDKSIGLYLLDNLPNLEKYFMAQMNGTEMHLDATAEVIAEYAMNFGLSMPNDGIDNPTEEVVKDLRNRLRLMFGLSHREFRTKRSYFW